MPVEGCVATAEALRAASPRWDTLSYLRFRVSPSDTTHAKCKGPLPRCHQSFCDRSLRPQVPYVCVYCSGPTEPICLAALDDVSGGEVQSFLPADQSRTLTNSHTTTRHVPRNTSALIATWSLASSPVVTAATAADAVSIAVAHARARSSALSAFSTNRMISRDEIRRSSCPEASGSTSGT